jgi:hypothetical protein
MSQSKAKGRCGFAVKPEPEQKIIHHRGKGGTGEKQGIGAASPRRQTEYLLFRLDV